MARVWEQELSCRTNKLLRDHRVMGRHLFPGTAFLQLALQHSRYRECTPVYMKNITFLEPLMLRMEESKKVTVLLSDETGGERFTIHSDTRQGNCTHVEGLISDKKTETPDNPGTEIPISVYKRCRTKYDRYEYYRRINKKGLVYGLYMQTIHSLFHNETEVIAELNFLDKVKGQAEFLPFHPALLDGAFQSLAVLSAGRPLSLPYYLEELSVFGPVNLSCLCYGYLRPDNRQDIPFIKHDFRLFDQEGRLQMEGIKFFYKYISDSVKTKWNDNER